MIVSKWKGISYPFLFVSFVSFATTDAATSNAVWVLPTPDIANIYELILCYPSQLIKICINHRTWSHKWDTGHVQNKNVFMVGTLIRIGSSLLTNEDKVNFKNWIYCGRWFLSRVILFICMDKRINIKNKHHLYPTYLSDQDNNFDANDKCYFHCTSWSTES